MLNIVKQSDPPAFARWKQLVGKTTNLNNYAGDYNDLLDANVKKALQKALYGETGGLCCYCMARIKAPTGVYMRLEHFLCQHANLAGKFDYKNMFCACCGLKGKDKDIEHCDVKKKSQTLSYNPAVDDVESMIVYRPNGEIRSTDETFDSELDSVLNLNNPYLKNNRREVLKNVPRLLEGKEWTSAQLSKKIADIESQKGTGKLPEYAGVTLFYLKRKLKAKQKA